MNNIITDHINIWITAQTQKSKGRNRGIDNIHQHGVKRLRELILELAVRGKLVPQDPNDEPGRELLKKIAEEKKQLIKEGKIKKQPVLSEVGEDEKPFDLPKGWAWTKLVNLAANIHYGFTASANENISQIRLLRITDIQNDKVDWETVPGCEIKEDDISKYVLENGDILIARTGGTIGKSYLVENINIESVFASYLIRVQRINGTFPEFIKVFLGSQLYWNQLYANSMGTGQPNVNGVALSNLALALPPLAEQHRIVAKVDELMALCDKLEEQQTSSLETHQLLVETLLKTLTDAKNTAELKAAWKQIESNFNLLFTTEESIDLLKQTILQLAVMGKLTQDFRERNPELVSGANSARELLKKIAAEKEKLIADGKIKKQNPLPEITDDEKPFELPDGWEFVRLGEIANKIGSGSTPRGGNSAYTDSGTIFLRSQNIRNEGLLLDEVAYITDETNEKMSNTIVFPNDILLNITGGSLGRCAIFPENLKMANVSQHVTIIRLTSLSSVRYMHLSILSPYIQNLIWGRQVGANREGLSKKILELFEIPIPPLDEQLRIVAKVDELFALCDALKERIDESQEIKVKLADAVVEVAVKDKPAGKVIYTVNEQLSLAAEPE
jgi:type I restriction enzyme, S subunit